MNIKLLHDSFCRGTLCEIPRFLELLNYLAARDADLSTILSLLDLDSFVRIPGDYSDTATYGYADLAFMANIKDSETDVSNAPPARVCVGFMVEHKSSPDNGVMGQLRKYYHHLMVQRLQRNVVEGIPSIAIILYNGIENWDPLEELLEKYPPALRKIALPFKCVMLNVASVPNEDCLKQMSAELGAIIATMKYVRDPPSARELFKAVLARLKGEEDKFTDRALDLIHQMDVYCNGWICKEFKETLKMDFVRPPYKTVADAIREETTEEVTKEVSYKAIVNALKRGKLTLQEIAEDNSVPLERVLEIQEGLKAQLA
ncbi:MAG: Rpn family recombination-promoting nuclease/putative transposase [Fibrobacter sp.]|nr:Rpn family recombination-promoting nuclease/putative transposase [Fibrobacter sp.]